MYILAIVLTAVTIILAITTIIVGVKRQIDVQYEGRRSELHVI